MIRSIVVNIVVLLLLSLTLTSSILLLKSINDIITIKGKDSLRFLQALATSDFESLSSTLLNSNNKQCSMIVPTSFVNVKGHVLYHCNCLVSYDNINDYDIKLFIDSNQGDSLRNYFNKYIFPLDRVKVDNDKKVGTLVTGLCNSDDVHKYLSVFDNNVNKVFKKLVGDDLSLMKPEISWKGFKNVAVYKNHDDDNLYAWKSNPFVSIDNKDPEESFDERLKDYSSGFTFIGEDSNKLLKLLENDGMIVPSGNEKVWESMTIATGVPSLHEIGAPMNGTALELGLMHTISFGKGCYTGQESLSHAISASGPLLGDGKRLNGIRRRLVGLRLKPEDISKSKVIKRLLEVVDETDESVGVVTSGCVEASGIDAVDKLTEGKLIGLVKSTSVANKQNLFIAINDNGKMDKIPVIVENLSFTRYDAPTSSSSPPVTKLANKGKEIIDVAKDNATDTAAALAKAKKLEEMAAKVAKLQAKKNLEK